MSDDNGFWVLALFWLLGLLLTAAWFGVLIWAIVELVTWVTAQ